MPHSLPRDRKGACSPEPLEGKRGRQEAGWQAGQARAAGGAVVLHAAGGAVVLPELRMG